MLSEEFVARHGLRYVILDTSERELELAPDGYEKEVMDLSDPAVVTRPIMCDLAVSRYVLEHIPDPSAFHANVRALLTPGGRAAHFFSTLWSLPFLVNRLLPGRLTGRLAELTLPTRDTEGHEAVFPATYRWCRGPTDRQIRRFESAGYSVEEYVGWFGHSYFRRIPPLQALEYRAAGALARRPVPALTSFAEVVLVKPV